MEGRNLTHHRHDTLVELSDHLRYLIGKNPTKITEVVMTLPWVKDLAAEGEDVAGTVSSIMGWRYRQKKPDEVVAALKAAGLTRPRRRRRQPPHFRPLPTTTFTPCFRWMTGQRSCRRWRGITPA